MTVKVQVTYPVNALLTFYVDGGGAMGNANATANMPVDFDFVNIGPGPHSFEASATVDGQTSDRGVVTRTLVAPPVLTILSVTNA